jgi:hypothetical protein
MAMSWPTRSLTAGPDVLLGRSDVRQFTYACPLGSVLVLPGQSVRPTEQLIHNKDGTIGQRNTYGSDPRRRQGCPASASTSCSGPLIATPSACAPAPDGESARDGGTLPVGWSYGPGTFTATVFVRVYAIRASKPFSLP